MLHPLRPPSSPLSSVDFPKFLLVGQLLSLLASASYSATSREEEDFFKTCSSHRCSKHGPDIRFPFRLSSHPTSCGAPGMLLSCSGHDTILDHPVLGACKVTEIYYRYGVINAIPLADSSSQCPLRKLVSTNQSTGVYKPVALEDSVLVGSHVILIAATTSAATLVILVATALYLSLKRRYSEAIHLKVEMFLKTYGTSKPIRYSFSEVKKIARRFKEKVGQGGFGSVYKGQLPNGVPVAVKMLESSTGDGEEFINEVATIGQIHHANIVRLLGFCSEGTRRALIYEFMPNESLERYIFLQDSNISQELLVPDKMLDIARGIARGMEYLHQGCNQRILHFDIKPHNILLDYSFNPKISDFGLAKLCARDQSIVTLTAARGTMGYIAPEQYSRNFGEVSYKSDVYSFGMLVLEMVSGKRNSDQSIENQSEVYLPEWIYERVATGQDIILNS
ncbi:hypothetical protein EJB05_31889, partial [Eragrostis curvula]